MDPDILRRIQDGDVDAFSVVVDEYSPRVIAFLASRLHDSMSVQDLAQETLVTAFHQLDRFEGRASFSTWLIGIARNKMLMHLRSETQRKNRHEKLQAELMVRLSSDLDAFANEETDYQLDRLRNCIGKLPDGLRELVVARYREAEPVRSIAERLTRSIPSITSSLFRAKKSLRSCMFQEVES